MDKLDPFKITDSFLGELQVSIHLSLQLLHIGLSLLLPLQRVFAFIETLLELALHLAKMVAPASAWQGPWTTPQPKLTQTLAGEIEEFNGGQARQWKMGQPTIRTWCAKRG